MPPRPRSSAKRDDRPGLQASIALFATGALAALGARADLRAGKRLAHDRAGADVGRHGVDFDAAADCVPARARGHPRRHRGAADRLRAAHRRRRRRHHADLQLAVVGLRHSGALVLGRQHLPAPRRRRCAVADGGIGGDPVHGAAGVHGNPPCRQRRRCLSPERRLDRGCAAGLRRAGDGDRTGAAAHPHRQRHSQCRRDPAHRIRGPCGSVRAAGAGESDGCGGSMSAASSSICCCSATPCRRCSRCCCPMRWRDGVRLPMPTRSRLARSFSRLPM